MHEITWRPNEELSIQNAQKNFYKRQTCKIFVDFDIGSRFSMVDRGNLLNSGGIPKMSVKKTKQKVALIMTMVLLFMTVIQNGSLLNAKASNVNFYARN